ncbi:MAG TPA: hypothetical protein VKM55_08740 [Candidatus Lokiarchaeia archaeon]|nr:hypothetical protein [Candidatus Lokiarchaeia archaeon]
MNECSNYNDDMILLSNDDLIFMPASAMPGIMNVDDAFIEKVLQVGGMLREVGDVDGALAYYEHFIGRLRRFTMVPLGVAVADEGMAREVASPRQMRME